MSYKNIWQGENGTFLIRQSYGYKKNEKYS